MDTDNIVSWVIGIIVAVLLLGSCIHQYNVVEQCDKDNGIVVKNYYNMPTCVEEGKH